VRKIVSYIILIALVFLTGCTGLRLMPKNQVLYTGAGLKINTKEKIIKKAKIKDELQDVLRPKPNGTFLGMRPGVWLYYVAGTPKKKKSVRSWIKNKLGEAPIYLSSVDTFILQKAIDAKLYNMGFLDSHCKYTIQRKRKGKTAYINFELDLKSPYTIKEFTFPTDTDELSKRITRTAKKTLLKVGEPYNLDVLVNERARIDEVLKHHGYYFFNKNFIEFLMDTMDRQVTLQLRLKNNIPDKSKNIYHINEVNVYPDYNISNDSLSLKEVVIDSVNYYSHTNYIHPKVILQSIYFRPDSTYDSRLQHRTLSRLNNLSVFKFINLELQEIDTSIAGKLNVNVMLSPLPKNSFTSELQVATKSDNFIGPGLSVSFRDRNAFKGAELLIFNISGSFETQYTGQYKGLFTYQVNPHLELDIPSIFPFHWQPHTDYLPHTKFALDYSYLSQVGYFDMNSFKLDIGYKWRKSMLMEHDLTLLNITLYDVYNRTQNFNDLINSNSLLASRFQEQFISGIGYSFFYNEQSLINKRNRFYFNGNAELSGNAISLISRAINKRVPDASNPSQVFGVDFAQYARLDIDVRDYIKITTNNMIALRLIAGWGLAYGNSSTLPYAKQFFSGGPYSLRGFPANGVGPGGYIAPADIKNVFYLEQGGEIKLELNAEYRFPIFKFLKGAVFADAGNTWLNHANSEETGGEFRSSQFIKQLAVDVGAGLRVDLSFFVIRFDIGLPVRSPDEPEIGRWVIDYTKFNSLVFNLAFGYPF
jgi:outer membrane protein insertion porin family